MEKLAPLIGILLVCASATTARADTPAGLTSVRGIVTVSDPIAWFGRRRDTFRALCVVAATPTIFTGSASDAVWWSLACPP